jgi:hypothetical protein
MENEVTGPGRSISQGIDNEQVLFIYIRGNKTSAAQRGMQRASYGVNNVVNMPLQSVFIFILR